VWHLDEMVCRIGGKQPAKGVSPMAHGLVADVDAALE
jgi:hypothetical protein